MSRIAVPAPQAIAPLAFVIVASLSAPGAAAVSAHTAPAPAAGAGMGGAPYPAPPAYPSGFEGWTRVKDGPSGALMGQPAGTHHIYANALAVEGYRSGRFADGAVLVFDVAGGQPAVRLRTDVMVRDSARYAETGGWGYAEWLEAPAADGGTGRRVNALVAAAPGQICHACHERIAADRGFVVSRMAK